VLSCPGKKDSKNRNPFEHQIFIAVSYACQITVLRFPTRSQSPTRYAFFFFPDASGSYGWCPLRRRIDSDINFHEKRTAAPVLFTIGGKKYLTLIR